jgi:predicted RNA binding protein YcfA (HicA-like mRNA interferase family)
VTALPSLSYRKAVNAFQHAGFVVIRQRGSHIRLQKQSGDKVIKITVPAYTPIKKSTPARIIKDVNLTVEKFNRLV